MSGKPQVRGHRHATSADSRFIEALRECLGLSPMCDYSGYSERTGPGMITYEEPVGDRHQTISMASEYRVDICVEEMRAGFTADGYFRKVWQRRRGRPEGHARRHEDG
jgi:hypothetical protein